MAVHTFDLRGVIGDRRPEDTLADEWSERLPRADRFGVHTLLVYGFITTGSPLVVAAGDSIVGIVGVPKSEVWELFSVTQQLRAVAPDTFNAVVTSIGEPPAANWGLAGVQKWSIAGWRDLPITRPKSFSGSNSFDTYDEASETDPGAGLRRRILYSRSALKPSMTIEGAETINIWNLILDCVRYPSTERLVEMLDKGEVTERELFSALALRYPSPAEAF